MLKAECGGAWRSYVLRSHWRMLFPISKEHQTRTASRLADEISRGAAPIIHLVRFPSLSINHGMILFGAESGAKEISFEAYDPNIPAKPSRLRFLRAEGTFELADNHYWAGGALDVIQIYRGWWM